jgi:hypothetical protein
VVELEWHRLHRFVALAHASACGELSPAPHCNLKPLNLQFKLRLARCCFFSHIAEKSRVASGDDGFRASSGLLPAFAVGRQDRRKNSVYRAVRSAYALGKY